MGRSVGWALLLTVGALALAGCDSSGSVKAGPQSSSTPASVAGPTSRSQLTTQSPSASPHLTGPVTFRPVLWTSIQDLPTPAPSADSEARALTALAALVCPQPNKTSQAADTDYLATCSTTDDTKYLLGPSALSGTHVSSATTTQANGQWQVDVTFDSAGAKTFGDLTSALAGTGKPIAITVGSTVISAPTVQSAITDGRLQIAGGQFDRAKAEDLAAALTAGAKS